MKRGHPKQMSESFLTAAFLSLSGGLQDAYTYIYRGHVFANAQTGNIVLLSQSIAERNWPQTLEYLIPLSFFAFGIAAAELLRFRYQSTTRIHWRQLVLLFEIAILFAVGFMPETCDLIANGIGNLRSGMESLCAYWKTQNRTNLQKSFCYWGIILMFAIGAALGVFCVAAFGARAIWISCLLLSVSFLFMFAKEDMEELKEEIEEIEEKKLF